SVSPPLRLSAASVGRRPRPHHAAAVATPKIPTEAATSNETPCSITAPASARQPPSSTAFAPTRRPHPVGGAGRAHPRPQPPPPAADSPGQVAVDMGTRHVHRLWTPGFRFRGQRSVVHRIPSGTHRKRRVVHRES